MTKIMCYECFKESEYKIIKQRRTINVKGVDVDVEIGVIKCSHCGEDIFDTANEIENDKIVFDAYKRKVGLLTSVEVKSIRNKYGISAITFSKLLGFGDKTITRYETGSIQDCSHDLIMRLVDIDTNMKFVWKQRKNELTISENKKLETYFNKSIIMSLEYNPNSYAYNFKLNNKGYKKNRALEA